MVKKDNSMLYIVAIVAIVAVVALIVLMTGRTGSTSLSQDIAGQAMSTQANKLLSQPTVDEKAIEAGSDAYLGPPEEFKEKEDLKAYCGNEIIEEGEQCDGSNLGGYTNCSMINKTLVGPLSCTSSCLFDLSQCERRGGGGGGNSTNTTNNTNTNRITGWGYNVDLFRYYNLDPQHFYSQDSLWGYQEVRTGTEGAISTSMNCRNGQWSAKSLYTNSQGKSVRVGDWSPYPMFYSTFSAESLFYSGESISCTLSAYLRADNGYLLDERNVGRDLNPSQESFVSLRPGTGFIYDELNQAYYMYVSAENYNGGICRIFYYVSTYPIEGNGESVFYTRSFSCRNTLTSIFPVVFSNPIEPGTQFYVNINLYTQGELNTMGSSWYSFDSASSQNVLVGGRKMVALAAYTDEAKSSELKSQVLRASVVPSTRTASRQAQMTDVEEIQVTS